MTDKRTAERPQWFSPTSGRITGALGAAVAVLVVVVAIINADLPWVAVGVIIGLLVWMVLLRPQVGLRGRTLLLRGVVSTTEIPLSLTSAFAIRQVFVVWLGERRYVNASLGRPMREMRRRPGQAEVPNPYLDHVLELVRSHRDDALRWGDEGGGVRRQWAVPELAGLAVALVAFVVLALV